MIGLDYSAQLAASAAEEELVAAELARREGAEEELEPPFPYAAIPFPPEVFGARPVEWIADADG